jgi:taurine dioxygenase
MQAKLEFRPLSRDLGAEVAGYDFDDVPGAVTVRSLRRALVDRHLLLLRGQPLDAARQAAFTLLFGSPSRPYSSYDCFIPGFSEIGRAGSGDGLIDIGPCWQSDGAHLSQPAAVSVHQIIGTAENADTLYAGLAAAYDRLPPEGRRHASRMRTRSRDCIAHPLVRPHPVTGRLGLYVNLAGDAAIIDEFGRENRAMRDALERHLCLEGAYYRHHWCIGDILVIDNFAVAHRAARTAPAASRIVHRTSIRGPRARSGVMMAS